MVYLKKLKKLIEDWIRFWKWRTASDQEVEKSEQLLI
jgi:hypothetical protein